MDKLQLKYNSLDITSKKEVRAFIDFLSGKMKTSQKKKQDYKKRILEVSTWSDKDVESIKENQSFNQFKSEEW